MTNTKGFPKQFNPNFDREKFEFLELANKGDGFTPINYIYSREGDFDVLTTSSFTASNAEVDTIYSDNIIRANDIQATTIEVVNSAQIANISISGNTITNSNNGGTVILESIIINNNEITAVSEQDVYFPDGVLLGPGTKFFNSSNQSDYVSFQPQSGVSATYSWPSTPELFITPITVIASVGPYLTRNSSGDLSWASHAVPVVPAPTLTPYNVGPYLTSDSSGILSLTSTKVPASIPDKEQIVETETFLTSDSTGSLSWMKAKIIVAPLPAIPPINDNKITVNAVAYLLPEYTGGNQ